jgi:DNA invertase Pin-like site-specific DNA recombinase
MDTNSIVEKLTEQRDRVAAAIDALTAGRKQRGPSSKSRKRGKMSEAGKKRISERMKARWAKAKRAGKNSL